MTFVRCGGDGSQLGCSTGYRSSGAQAATRLPQLSQNLLSGLSAAPHRSHTERGDRLRPQEEQKIASGSGRGPHVVQAGLEPGGRMEASDGIAAEAERSVRTLAATMASISSDAASSGS